MHLLHLEDSSPDSEIIADQLRAEWQDCTIERVDSREAFVDALRNQDFDLILSDYSIPGFDGLSALDMAHAAVPETPFIFVSGTIGEDRAIDAMNRGAADYVIKDRPRRLTVAIRQALDRAAMENQRRVAEKRLREQTILLAKSRDAICVIDRDGGITFWNESAARLFGWTEVEVDHKELGALLFAKNDAPFGAAFEETLVRGEWRGELRPLARDGQVLTVDSHWTLVAGDDGVGGTALIIMTDMTERKRLETEIIRSQRLESIAMLCTGIAHDLNNVLTPIVLGASVLRSDGINPKLMPVLSSIETSAELGTSLVRQLSAFARGSDGRRVRVEVEPALATLRNLLQQCLPKTIDLQLRVDSSIWPINAEPTQLNQLVINLCLNARDAMPGGGTIHVRARNVEVDRLATLPVFDAKPGQYVSIEVIDHGSGIPAAIMDRIFDPFFTTKRLGQGTGLGLSNVVAILKSHQGFLTVDSKVGSGSTFRIFLPALVAPVAVIM